MLQVRSIEKTSYIINPFLKFHLLTFFFFSKFFNTHYFLVLKYADSVLKGYATAVSVVLTGVLSSHLFGTDLSMLFGMGMINVVVSVLLYNSSGLDDYLC